MVNRKKTCLRKGLDEGININMTNVDGQTGLHLICVNQNLQVPTEVFCLKKIFKIQFISPSIELNSIISTL